MGGLADRRVEAGGEKQNGGEQHERTGEPGDSEMARFPLREGRPIRPVAGLLVRGHSVIPC